MSLLNANDGNYGTVIVKKVVRNSKTESISESIMYDMGESIDFWSKALNFIYRRRTFAKIKKRDKICGGPSAYIECLAEVSMGNNVNAAGRTAETVWFNYICKYCKMEIMVHNRNKRLGNVNPVIEEMLANPPQPNGGLIRGSKYCNKIMLECRNAF